ncbi:MAG: bifunctional folylpolyglutamate synthase/dihydrofolate synthase [Candidatus Fonsibacter sp.]|nr:bifunctional folylpolyglutamate synthase/dihydrofolate synthase [Candidatus Fonsibacter sp.]
MDQLLTLHPKKIDLSLDRIKILLQKLNNPQDKLKNVINCVGTKGKGSTCAFLKSILEHHNKTVNMYVSPHLQRFNERIILKDKEISDELLNEVLKKTMDEIKKSKLTVTFFEATTSATYLAFVKHPADYTILECGLGGRLDTTAVVNKPIAQIITPISNDHEEFLGDTLEKITYEKCGILKQNTKIIISKQSSQVLKQIDKEIENNKSPRLIFGEDFQISKENGRFIYQDDQSLFDLDLPNLQGDHQLINAGTAIAAAQKILGKLDTKKLNLALKNTKHRARLEKITKGKLLDYINPNNQLYLDGAHNEAAAEAVSKYLENIKGKKIYMILGMLNTKDPKVFLKHFTSIITALKTVNIPNQDNSQDPNTLAKIANKFGIKANQSKNVTEALHEIANEDPNAVIIITGSLYLMGEVLNLN